jgi:Fe2+ or Zn2+ uptake regulation protein
MPHILDCGVQGDTVENAEDEVSRLRQQLARMSDLLEQERREKRETRNMDFVQVSRAELRAISELGAKSSTALDLLMVLAQAMDKQNAVMISYRAIEDFMGKSRATIDRALRILKDDNWIQIVKVGTANAYVINSAVFWTDRGDRKQFANFKASIVTTLAEQDKDLRLNTDVKLKRVSMVTPREERALITNEDLPPPDQKDLDLN